MRHYDYADDVYDADDDQLRTEDRIARRANQYWCCDGYGCQCGGATVAEMAEDEEQDDEMP